MRAPRRCQGPLHAHPRARVADRADLLRRAVALSGFDRLGHPQLAVIAFDEAPVVGKARGKKQRKRDSPRKRKPTLHWKEVEALVGKLESLLHGAAKIRVDVKIPSRTGGLRQVDVEVRVVVGGTPMLIVLECRGRRRTEDVTWIEQLATKKDNVRAAAIIGVSSSGFSKEALRVAADCGVELRTLEQLDANDFRRWVPGFHVEFSRMTVDVLNCQVAHGDDWQDGLLQNTTCGDRVFSRPGHPKRFSLHDLIELAKARPSATVVVGTAPDVTQPTETTERMEFRGPFDAHIGGKAWRVEALVADVKFSTKATPMPIRWTQRYETVGAAAPHVARAVLDTKAVPDVKSAAVSYVPSQKTLTFEVERPPPRR